MRESFADGGVVGLITQATTLTNDQSADYRFLPEHCPSSHEFLQPRVRSVRVGAEPAVADLIYSVVQNKTMAGEIVHFGPLVANQPATAPGKNRRRRVPWVLTICESEIQIVSAAEAARGDATTWKRALWGNPRDRRVERLRRVLPTTLGALAEARGWHLNLGLQLRSNSGTKSDPNQSILEIKQTQGQGKSEAREFAEWFGGLSVIDPKQPHKTNSRLTVQGTWLVRNRWGTFLRQGRDAGLDIVRAPHVFLWNEFAAFSDRDFIFRHPKLGLSAPSADIEWLRAVSVIWTSSITPYCLFLNLSAGWGISRSTIDLGDAHQMPMPNLTTPKLRLANLHRLFATEEAHLSDRNDWQFADQQVASLLKIPPQVILLARNSVNFDSR